MKYELGGSVEDFELTNHDGESRSLSTGLENGNMMIVFFRGFW